MGQGKLFLKTFKLRKYKVSDFFEITGEKDRQTHF